MKNLWFGVSTVVLFLGSQFSWGVPTYFFFDVPTYSEYYGVYSVKDYDVDLNPHVEMRLELASGAEMCTSWAFNETTRAQAIFPCRSRIQFTSNLDAVPKKSSLFIQRQTSPRCGVVKENVEPVDYDVLYRGRTIGSAVLKTKLNSKGEVISRQYTVESLCSRKYKTVCEIDYEDGVLVFNFK